MEVAPVPLVPVVGGCDGGVLAAQLVVALGREFEGKALLALWVVLGVVFAQPQAQKYFPLHTKGDNVGAERLASVTPQRLNAASLICSTFIISMQIYAFSLLSASTL